MSATAAVATSKYGDYEPIYKELDKLDALFELSSPALPNTGSTKKTKNKSKSIQTSLDTLLASLRDAKTRLSDDAGEGTSEEVALAVSAAVELSKKEIEERQKEVYNSLNRMGKALEKKFPETLPNYGPLFSSPSASKALDRVIALHLLRTGSTNAADAFIKEANVDLGRHTVEEFEELHKIVDAIRSSNLDPALQWCGSHRTFLQSRKSSLEFNLHRTIYIHLLLSPLASSNPSQLLKYARTYFPPLYTTHSKEIMRLINALAYLPVERLATSPYADLIPLSGSIEGGAEEKGRVREGHGKMLEDEFVVEYCAHLKMGKQPPLRVVGDLGGGGALSRIEKGKKVMLESKSEWTANDELPIEIPVPRENRYHSLFACPVSKEQATELNPPMMLACGHVLAKESILKLAKGGGRVKCPYCPIESTQPPQRVWF